MRRLMAVGAVFGFLIACGEGQPCDEYVDYMCDCHGDEVDCTELSTSLVGGSQDVQDQCSIDLAEQESADEEAGDECITGV